MTTAPPVPGTDTEEPPIRKLYRSAEGRWLGGVAQGLAGHLAVPVSWVRFAFFALTVASGMGVVLYGVFWFVVPLGTGPLPPRPHPGATAPGGSRLRQYTIYVLAVVMLTVGAGVFWNNVQFEISGGYLWTLALIVIGAALVWRQADDSRRAHWAKVTRGSRWLPLARSAAGVTLVLIGVAGFVVTRASEDLSRVVQAALAVLVGTALLAGPYLVRILQDLNEERTMRIRAQERAEVAAHVHDSVLHTLTLIQRNASDHREVSRLARAQERELRAWLHKSAEATNGVTVDDEETRTFSETVKATVAEVEDHHGVPIEVVCVGDCPVDEPLAAMLQAAREAMVNAAKYGGEGGPVQVFAEVEGREVFVSVRDRGPGFDLDDVPTDRMGVRESIIGRMQRNGGRARVRSVPGEGTEVELMMERAE
ncbi:ATP-binding protein [Streptomyces spiramenti]|uniref:PspC domain-containing protein n=1 Tax=Streptomyces spiramenti TaxID=2720606 RepID=A0ABX1AGR6_9ACTN|nr:ATP-binding protein [Streptomyces spiramenti]NJP66329.1 PspC domain-containing protein [Streptomyces spiramenti]